MGTRKIAMHIKPGCIILINSISSKTWIIIRVTIKAIKIIFEKLSSISYNYEM